MLSITALVKRFGQATAVDGVSFDIAAGTITGLIGPNGAGKTTLFNCVAGHFPPTSGSVRLAGEEIAGRPAERIYAAGLARTFQIPRPFPAMTVLENVMLARRGQTGERVLGSWLRPARVSAEEAENRERALHWIDFVGLSRLADEPARVLSGGQRKLLELARVLQGEPRLVLLDEPAAGVNPTLLDEIMARIESLNAAGLTFLVVEHNMDLVARLCGSVHVMAEGRLIASGRPAEVTREAHVVEAYLGGLAA
jgi:branched-chain amino acid transport system ATP-binding protein